MAALAIAVALVAGGCESERLVTIDNTSSSQLRVFVKVPGGGVSSVTPAPGSSSSVVAGETGDYYAFAILDAEWLESISFRRDFLSRQLADPAVRRRLSFDELMAISDQVNQLAVEIRRATETPANSLGACSGTITDEAGSGVVTITDNRPGEFPAYLLTCRRADPQIR